MRKFIIFVFAALVSATNAWATQYISSDCSADDHVAKAASPGTLVITDYSVNYTLSNCPTKRISTNYPINFRVGDTLFFWIRLQGDQAYLSDPDSSLPLRASFYLKTGDQWTYLRALPLGEISNSDAAREASGPDGLFDWRVFAEKWSLSVPGQYKLRVEQGTRSYCLYAHPECGILFSVE